MCWREMEREIEMGSVRDRRSPIVALSEGETGRQGRSHREVVERGGGRECQDPKRR